MPQKGPVGRILPVIFCNLLLKKHPPLPSVHTHSASERNTDVDGPSFWLLRTLERWHTNAAHVGVPSTE